jgi:phosphonate transport system ATP-binding protein
MTVNAGNTLRVDGLSKRYGNVLALDDLTVSVEPGEMVVLLGPSGAGKSTLFRCLTGLVKPDEGEVWLLGEPIHRLDRRALQNHRRSIGLVFQQHNLVGRLSAMDNVLTGRLGSTPMWRVLARQFAPADRQAALASLDRVGLLDQAYQRSDSLSGGQQQRVAIARVLAQHCKILLADEPVASLDPESARRVLSDLRRVAREEGLAVLCSLHQVEWARQFADRVVGLRSGRVAFDCPVADLTDSRESALYQAPAGSARS